MRTSPTCIAVIADVVRSRRIAVTERSQLQEDLETFLSRLNKRHSKFVLARFVITTGDEFQGLLSAATPIPDLLWEMEQELRVTLRVGIGLGTLLTPLHRSAAVGMDGPAWHQARDAIMAAKKRKKLGGVFVGFDKDDPLLNGLARLLRHFRDSLVPSQRQTLARLRSLQKQSALVGDLAPTKQAVHERVKSASWPVYQEGEAAFRAALSAYDFSRDWRAR